MAKKKPRRKRTDRGAKKPSALDEYGALAEYTKDMRTLRDHVGDREPTKAEKLLLNYRAPWMNTGQAAADRLDEYFQQIPGLRALEARLAPPGVSDPEEARRLRRVIDVPMDDGRTLSAVTYGGPSGRHPEYFRLEAECIEALLADSGGHAMRLKEGASITHLMAVFEVYCYERRKVGSLSFEEFLRGPFFGDAFEPVPAATEPLPKPEPQASQTFREWSGFDGLRWDQVTITVRSDPHEALIVSAKGKTRDYNAFEAGLMTKGAKPRPLKAWTILCKMGEDGGRIRGDAHRKYTSKRNLTDLRNRLRRLVGIDGNPISDYTRDDGWKCEFHLISEVETW